MKATVMQVCFAIISAILMSGCADNVPGSYSKDKSSLTVVLSKNGAFQLNTGGVGSYSVRGSKISMINSVCGTARGEIKDTSLVFPPAKDDNPVAQSFEGKWIKRK